MTRNTSQGAGARQGAPKSPAPAPSSASALDDRIAVLEEALTDVRESMGVLRREVASMQRVLDIRGREISEFIKVREREAVGTPSKDEKQPIPVYYGKRFLLSSSTGLCPKTWKQH